MTDPDELNNARRYVAHKLETFTDNRAEYCFDFQAFEKELINNEAFRRSIILVAIKMNDHAD